MTDEIVPRRSFEETLRWSHEVRENPIRHHTFGDSHIIIYLSIFGGIVFFLIAIWIYSIWVSSGESEIGSFTPPGIVRSPVYATSGNGGSTQSPSQTIESSGVSEPVKNPGAPSGVTGNPSPPTGPVINRRAPVSSVAVSLPRRGVDTTKN